MATESIVPQPKDIIEKLKKNIAGNKHKSHADEEDEILPFKMDYLTKRMKETLKSHLRETDENKEKGLEGLRALIEDEKDLVARLDDGFLLQFLRARKYDVKKAFKLYQNYYAFRKEFEHIYDVDNINVQKLKEVVLRNYLGFLTHRDRFGSAVFVGKIANWDPDVDGFEDLFQTLSGCCVYSNELPASQVAGYRAIFDLRNMTWKQMKFATPYNLYLIVRSMQYCFPGRYRAVHVLSGSKFVNAIWATVLPFLSKKIRQRIHFHGKNVSDLKKFIDPSVLPEEFGGQAPAFNNKCWTEEMDEQEDILKAMLKYGYK